MEVKKIEGKPNFIEIIELLNAEWPKEFGIVSDGEKVLVMAQSYNLETDTVKYLYEKDKIIGLYRYSLWPRDDKETKQAHTFDIAVLPEYQRKGYGMELVKDMIEECKKHGIEKLLSRSFKNNNGSIKLHKKAGFKLRLETTDSLVWEIVV